MSCLFFFGNTSVLLGQTLNKDEQQHNSALTESLKLNAFVNDVSDMCVTVFCQWNNNYEVFCEL